jgi:hypothetical protein
MRVDARVALFARLIDHAPLSPPASLSLPEALEEDRRALESEASFALARFVCPASLVRQLADNGREISVVLDRDLPATFAPAAVELTYSHRDPGSLRPLASEVYVEVAIDDALEARLDELAENGLRAKVRCGGATVPTGPELARLFRGCASRGLRFKATAGLHHAVRRGSEHGLVNLLAAVVSAGDEEDALSESDPHAFAVTPEAFSWRGRTAGADELECARLERLHSIGSCSFFEPIEELERLGMLPP